MNFFNLLGILIVLIAILLIKTFTYPFKKNNSDLAEGWKAVKNDLVIQRLSEGIKIPTVSIKELDEFNYSTFETFKEYLISYLEVY